VWRSRERDAPRALKTLDGFYKAKTPSKIGCLTTLAVSGLGCLKTWKV